MSYGGLRKRPTFNQLVNYIERDQPKIKYPDRRATFLANSHQLNQFFGLDPINMQEEQKHLMTQQIFQQRLSGLATPSIFAPEPRPYTAGEEESLLQRARLQTGAITRRPFHRDDLRTLFSDYGSAVSDYGEALSDAEQERQTQQQGRLQQVAETASDLLNRGQQRLTQYFGMSTPDTGPQPENASSLEDLPPLEEIPTEASSSSGQQQQVAKKPQEVLDEFIANFGKSKWNSLRKPIKSQIMKELIDNPSLASNMLGVEQFIKNATDRLTAIEEAKKEAKAEAKAKAKAKGKTKAKPKAKSLVLHTPVPREI